jgi:hypothetical protein
MGQRDPRRWLGAGSRLLAVLFFFCLVVALSGCGVTISPRGATATAVPPSDGTNATLHVEVLPRGATLLVDGLRSGTTPATLSLPPGQHDVVVEMNGYESRSEAVTLAAGSEVTIRGELVPLAASPPPSVTLIPTAGQDTPAALPDLAIAYVQITLETGADCNYSSTELGTRVVVENIGTADAGPFAVEVNGSQQTVKDGLAAGQTVTLWFEGYAYGGETTVVVDPAAQVAESDEANNTLSQMVPIPTLPATCTPPAATPSETPVPPATETPVPPPTQAPDPLPTETPVPVATSTPAPPPPAAAVTMHEGQVTIPTYPYAAFLTEGWNESFRVPYSVLDRGAYDASSPVPRDVTYRTLVVENEYVRLTFLPDLGGRLYEVLYKPTGHRETYRNPVLKPSPWGPPEQGWWLAAGGIEWCLPVEEHGYEWDIPWKVYAEGDGQSISVSLRDTAANVQDRVRAEIVVKLEAGAAYFTIRPRIENPTGAPLAVKYWTNAMLAPGGQNAPSADLRFVLPDALGAVTVHSRGDEFLPAAGERMSWPGTNGVDMSRLGNWNRWLGFFENPAVGGFMAVYDNGYDEGMVRVFPADVAKGAKVFAMGWQDPIPPSTWTDDGSSYVEIHGGPAPTFGDSVTIPAGGSLQWTESWYPMAGLGGLRYANKAAALNLAAGAGQARIGVAVTRAWSGAVVLLLDDQEVWRQEVSLMPGKPFRELVPLGEGIPQTGQLALRLEGADGAVVSQYGAEFNLR